MEYYYGPSWREDCGGIAEVEEDDAKSVRSAAPASSGGHSSGKDGSVGKPASQGSWAPIGVPELNVLGDGVRSGYRDVARFQDSDHPSTGRP